MTQRGRFIVWLAAVALIYLLLIQLHRKFDASGRVPPNRPVDRSHWFAPLLQGGFSQAAEVRQAIRHLDDPVEVARWQQMIAPEAMSWVARVESILAETPSTSSRSIDGIEVVEPCGIVTAGLLTLALRAARPGWAEGRIESVDDGPATHHEFAVPIGQRETVPGEFRLETGRRYRIQVVGRDDKSLSGGREFQVLAAKSEADLREHFLYLRPRIDDVAVRRLLHAMLAMNAGLLLEARTEAQALLAEGDPKRRVGAAEILIVVYDRLGAYADRDRLCVLVKSAGE